MATAAIKAQGTKLEMSTGTGGAVTITGMAVGYPTILTATAHGLTDGDVVTLANFAGDDAATINAQVVPVTHVTTNTFAVAVDTTGKTITDNTDAATATPVTYTEIKECKSFKGFDGEASEIDVTSLDSSAKEFLAGLRDYGGIDFEMNWLADDTGQAALRAAAAAGTTKNWKLTLVSGTLDVASFAGFIKSVPISGGVDAAVTGSFRIRITGAVSWA